MVEKRLNGGGSLVSCEEIFEREGGVVGLSRRMKKTKKKEEKKKKKKKIFFSFLSFFFLYNLNNNKVMTKMAISSNLNFLFTLLHSFQHLYKTI